MALFGMDIPVGRGPDDALRREEVFEIIAPYVLSESDMGDYPRLKGLLGISDTFALYSLRRECFQSPVLRKNLDSVRANRFWAGIFVRNSDHT